MPFSNLFFYVKANSSPTNEVRNSVTLDRHEASTPVPREEAVPVASSSSSTTSTSGDDNNHNNEASGLPSPSTASLPTPPFDSSSSSSLSSSFPALKNLEATAIYLTEKVKRIIRNNFGSPGEGGDNNNDNVVDTG